MTNIYQAFTAKDFFPGVSEDHCPVMLHCDQIGGSGSSNLTTPNAGTLGGDISLASDSPDVANNLQADLYPPSGPANQAHPQALALNVYAGAGTTGYGTYLELPNDGTLFGPSKVFTFGMYLFKRQITRAVLVTTERKGIGQVVIDTDCLFRLVTLEGSLLPTLQIYNPQSQVVATVQVPMPMLAGYWYHCVIQLDGIHSTATLVWEADGFESRVITTSLAGLNINWGCANKIQVGNPHSIDYIVPTWYDEVWYTNNDRDALTRWAESYNRTTWGIAQPKQLSVENNKATQKVAQVVDWYGTSKKVTQALGQVELARSGASSVWVGQSASDQAGPSSWAALTAKQQLALTPGQTLHHFARLDQYPASVTGWLYQQTPPAPVQPPLYRGEADWTMAVCVGDRWILHEAEIELTQELNGASTLTVTFAEGTLDYGYSPTTLANETLTYRGRVYRVKEVTLTAFATLVVYAEELWYDLAGAIAQRAPLQVNEENADFWLSLILDQTDWYPGLSDTINIAAGGSTYLTSNTVLGQLQELGRAAGMCVLFDSFNKQVSLRYNPEGSHPTREVTMSDIGDAILPQVVVDSSQQVTRVFPKTSSGLGLMDFPEWDGPSGYIPRGSTKTGLDYVLTVADDTSVDSMEEQALRYLETHRVPSVSYPDITLAVDEDSFFADLQVGEVLFMRLQGLPIGYRQVTKLILRPHKGTLAVTTGPFRSLLGLTPPGDVSTAEGNSVRYNHPASWAQVRTAHPTWTDVLINHALWV